MPVDSQAVITWEAEAAVHPEPIQVDDPGPGEILVRILASGVCHTDLHVRDGKIGTPPILLGHEGAAIVEAVGEGVEQPRVGDYVILAWRAPCGTCRFCRRGLLHLCSASLNAKPRQHTPSGVFPPPILGIGTFATHTVVAAGQAIPVSQAIGAPEACLIGCGVMTGIGAAWYTAGVRAGSSVAVFGCGTVGTSVIQGARLAHATRIIAVDLEPRKLEWARQFGATDTIDASQGDVVEQIKALTGGYGVDYAFECVGSAQVLQQVLACRDLAGIATLIGVAGRDSTITLELPRYFDLGGSLRVSWYGDCLPTRDFPLLVDLYLRGDLLLSELITQRVSLDEVDSAFAAMQRGETLKSVIVFD
ncbi:MAG: Zn-dependent alcohol dehydrogenase [Chloroflexi bacterium]|nr:Zn-dependent alcohol dehydrogenase [Chloroflexota bacterium]